MGKKGSWLYAVKRALSPEAKEKKDKKPRHSKKRLFGKQKSLDVDFRPVETAPVIPPPPPPPPPPPAPSREVEVIPTLTKAENEQSRHAYAVAVATAVAAEAAATTAQAAAEVVRLTSTSLYSGKSTEEIAAIQIQTAFRGYLSRKALRVLKGQARLKSLIQGQSVKRQASKTLKCMQTLARVQSQIQTRRLRISEENQALQRQLLQKHQKEAEILRASSGEDWNASAQSKEEVEAKLQHKQEAAIRRERALAYAHSHQQTWRTSPKPATQTFMDSNNPHWGWSWLERWMATRPWECRSTTTDTELHCDLAPLKITTNRAIPDNSLSPTTNRLSQSPHRQSPSTTPKAQSPTLRKTRTTSPRVSACGSEKALHKPKSEQYRRHSIPSDKGNAKTTHIASTKSTKVRTPMPSPLGMVPNGTPKKQSSTSSAKKMLSFSSSSIGVRRLSGPSKVDTGRAKDNVVES